MSLGYYIATCLNTLCHLSNLHTIKTSQLWNIYIYVMVSFVWRGDLLLYNLLVYFIVDLINAVISKKLKIFTIYHHVLCIISIYLSINMGIIDRKLFEIGAIQEIPTIPLSLFHTEYISKPVNNILFSYSFIFIRLIYYNYAMYSAWVTDRHIFNNYAITAYILMNLTNIGIAWKMKLVQKLFAIRPAIDYLCDTSCTSCTSLTSRKIL
jgi:hypothetical protein